VLLGAGVSVAAVTLTCGAGTDGVEEFRIGGTRPPRTLPVGAGRAGADVPDREELCAAGALGCCAAWLGVVSVGLDTGSPDGTRVTLAGAAGTGLATVRLSSSM
jgi:hypothetical protein